MKLPSLPEGEITAIEVHRANPYVELGISIVGGNETPLINVVIQEVYRDGVIARDGRLLAGDQILQVGDLTERTVRDHHLSSYLCLTQNGHSAKSTKIYLNVECFSIVWLTVLV